MIRTLTIVTVAAFFLSVVCLTVAVSIAGPDIISENVWSWSGPWGHHHWGHHGRGFTLNYDASTSDSPQASREEAWSGESLEVDVPADVRFTQAPGAARLVIRGPRDTLDHVRVENGQIRCDVAGCEGDGKVQVELTAPKVTRFAVNGSGKLDITGYSQDSLDVRLAGDGAVSAQGSAKAVKLDISGSGDADLANISGERAEVSISGSGHAKIAPKSWAKLDISGSGDVDLLSHPGHLESHVSGSGSINQDDGATPPPPAEPDQPAKPAKVGKKA